MFLSIPTSTSHRRQAFSLVEVLVLVALFAVSILGLVSAQFYALKSGEFNRARHTAATILDSELNLCRAQLAADFSEEIAHGREAVEYQPDFVTAATCIYALPVSSDENLKKVAVTVYWQDPGTTQERQVSAWTYVYRVH